AFGSAFSSCQLSLANGMHDFNAGNRTAGSPKGFAPYHWPHLAFHCAVILRHDMIEIRALPDADAGLVGALVVGDRRRVTPPRADQNLLRESVGANRLVEKGLGRVAVARGSQ